MNPVSAFYFGGALVGLYEKKGLPVTPSYVLLGSIFYNSTAVPPSWLYKKIESNGSNHIWAQMRHSKPLQSSALAFGGSLYLHYLLFKD